MTLLQTQPKRGFLPPGPAEPFRSAEDLFQWMNQNFERFGDIFKATVYGSVVYVVNAPEYCEHILRRNWLNYPRKGLVVKRIALALGNNLITSNGEFWASQRRMIQPAFTKSAISGWTAMMADVNAELLQQWIAAAERQETVNVTRDVSLMVLKITLMSIFGDDYETVAPHFKFFAEEAARDFKFAQSLAALRELIFEIVAGRRRERIAAADTLGVMMDARDRQRGESMADAQLAREVINLVVAGHETTASLLNWMWYLLASHPEAQERLAVELDEAPWEGRPAMDMLPNYPFTRQVVDEALRLYPPLWLMTRKALNDDRLRDYFVPAGTEIFISPFLIQRSPQLWEAPDRFDPDRLSPNKRSERHELSLCPFGAGPRKCIGDLFARVEIQMHLMMFGKELRLRPREMSLPEIATGINLLSKHDFHMLPDIRSKGGRLKSV
ncbi:MAG: cytochrome P450 [Hyphomicrobiales bacterium]|nr:cytochrome P450 [Hyphomicrobiales bacterium]